MIELAKIGYGEYAAAKERFMRGTQPAWDELTPTEQGCLEAFADAVATRAIAATRLHDRGDEEDDALPSDGGLWLRIAFMGHVELTGYVTEVTIGGQPAFHVDLPDRLWGGNPHAWEEYSASALYSRRPVTEESVRKAWEAEIARRAAREARQQQYALTAAGDGEDDDEDGTGW